MISNSLVGQYTTLPICEHSNHGVYLALDHSIETSTDGSTDPISKVLLPTRYVPTDYELGQQMPVFIYKDSEDRLVATTEQPYAIVNQCAYLKIVAISRFGAFLDWGLLKDLFVPFREQTERLNVGDHSWVYLYIDLATDRIVATMKLNKFVKNRDDLSVTEGEVVDVQIAEETEYGYRCIIQHQHWGLLYHSEIFQPLEIGQIVSVYIKKIREDLKIDLALQASGYRQAIPDAALHVLNALEKSSGFLPLTDKSPPHKIYESLQISKKVYKKAIGTLYKQRLISLKKDGIYSVKKV